MSRLQCAKCSSHFISGSKEAGYPEQMKISLALALMFVTVSVSAAFTQVIKPVPPDDRFKADILIVAAHPDDETMVTGYLARAIFDEHKRVAVIFGTRGAGGGDATGQ